MWPSDMRFWELRGDDAGHLFVSTGWTIALIVYGILAVFGAIQMAFGIVGVIRLMLGHRVVIREWDEASESWQRKEPQE